MLQFRETYIEKRNFYALMEPIDIKNISIILSEKNVLSAR